MVLAFKPFKILLPKAAQSGIPHYVARIRRDKQAALNAKHAKEHVERVLEVVPALSQRHSRRPLDIPFLIHDSPVLPTTDLIPTVLHTSLTPTPLSRVWL